MLAGDLASAVGNVAQSGSDIEQRRVALQIPQRVLDFFDRGADATEQRIGSRNIGQRTGDDCGIDIWQVEIVDSTSTWWCQQAQHGSALQVRVTAAIVKERRSALRARRFHFAED